MTTNDEFPRDQWETLKTTMETAGPAAVIDLIAGYDDLLARRKLYLFATGQFAWQDWQGKNLDGYVEVTRWAIEDSLRQAAAESDEEDRKRRVNLANVLSYNLSAKLADCWGDDPLPRERRHFELGLKAANDCVRWREELNNGAFPLSIAHWACGMHQVSLDDAAGAVASFTKSLDFAARSIREKEDAEPSVTAHFGIALGAGYLGIAEHLAGNESGRGRYEEAVAAFQVMAEDAETKDDAEMGLDQIRTVWERYCG